MSLGPKLKNSLRGGRLSIRFILVLMNQKSSVTKTPKLVR